MMLSEQTLFNLVRPPAAFRETMLEIVRTVDPHLVRAMQLQDGVNDAAWLRCRQMLDEYAIRPAKRIRAGLLYAGFKSAWRDDVIPDEMWRFAAAIELLHTFMLVHDDIADRSDVRRNGVALHKALAPSDPRKADNLGVVAGDYLFARAVELMLDTKLSFAPDVTRYYMEICRQTAAGQYLDLHLEDIPLKEVSLFQTMRVAQLKTARYGFVAPLVAGAKLAGADAAEQQLLERIGRLLGLSYQFVDDLIGMFGDSSVTGKPADSDFLEGKRTFPVVAAYVRADAATRSELDALWNAPKRNAGDLDKARSLITTAGGKTATQRVIQSTQRSARTLIGKLRSKETQRFLQQLNDELARRKA